MKYQSIKHKKLHIDKLLIHEPFYNLSLFIKLNYNVDLDPNSVIGLKIGVKCGAKQFVEKSLYVLVQFT